MKTFQILSLLYLLFSSTFTFISSNSLLEDEVIQEGYFKDQKLSQIKKLFGLKNTRPYINDVEYNSKSNFLIQLPAQFDGREKFKHCIHPIRDQGNCGSCWAFGATEALSDRFCIKGKDVILSPQELVSCVDLNYGCRGGYLEFAWSFLQSTGAVTEQCFPYINGVERITPGCVKSCTNPLIKYVKHKAKSIIKPSTIEDIKLEIYNNGPVETGFEVYKDFLFIKAEFIYENQMSSLEDTL